MHSFEEDNQIRSDEELVKEAQLGSAESFELLLARYKPLVRAQASRYFLSGGDRDDLIQEGMIGLFKAVHGYDPIRQIPFAALAKTTVHHAILDALRRDQAGKQRPLNESDSLYWTGEDNTSEQVQTVDTEASGVIGGSPLSDIEADEAASRVMEQMTKLLSPRELAVLSASIKGQTRDEIAKNLALEPKQVVYALARARKKLRDRLLT